MKQPVKVKKICLGCFSGRKYNFSRDLKMSVGFVIVYQDKGSFLKNAIQSKSAQSTR